MKAVLDCRLLVSALVDHVLVPPYMRLELDWGDDWMRLTVAFEYHYLSVSLA